MKIHRQGHYRRTEITLLVDHPIKDNNAKFRAKSPRWIDEDKELCVRLKGVEGDATYDYDFRFSAEDLYTLIKSALLDLAKTPHDAAFATAISEYINSLLSFEPRQDKSK